MSPSRPSEERAHVGACFVRECVLLCCTNKFSKRQSAPKSNAYKHFFLTTLCSTSVSSESRPPKCLRPCRRRHCEVISFLLGAVTVVFFASCECVIALMLCVCVIFCLFCLLVLNSNFLVPAPAVIYSNSICVAGLSDERITLSFTVSSISFTDSKVHRCKWID